MRLVIKIGTSTITYSTGKINYRRIDNLCKVVSDLKNSGVEVILVSSGAIGMGVGKLHLHKKPTDIATKQAAASVGQCELMYVYDRAFTEFNQTVSQILITAEDVETPSRLKNFRNTINNLIIYIRSY